MASATISKKKSRERTSRRLKDQEHGYFARNKVEMVKMGKPFFTLLKTLIDNARETIHIQTYIFGEDTTGLYIADALKEAAKRGVQVWLMVDGYASQKLSKNFQNELKDAGVKFRFFEPFFRSKHFYFGRRLHHKIVVVDSCDCLVGSMNIADKYNDIDGEKAWFDMAVHIKGNVALELERICVRFFYGRSWKVWRWSNKKPGAKKEMDFPESYNVPIRVRQNDWIQKKGQATSSYFQLFHKAEKSISVVCSYVLPGKGLRAQMVKAAKKGVKIRFVLAGTSDVKVVKAAERYLYRWMARYNMKLYEYQTTILHTKMAAADGEFMTLGSYNLNNLSAYASIELNLDIKNKSLVSKVEKEIDGIIEKDCEEVDLDHYTTHLFSWKQLMRWSAYQLTRMAEKLVTKK
jgi:cardiolipin synthase A/B